MIMDPWKNVKLFNPFQDGTKATNSDLCIKSSKASVALKFRLRATF